MSVFSIFICVVAGLGAGFSTGTIGLSAATIITPMLVTFLGFPAYQAVAISLASDVLASAISAYIYSKNDNINYKTGVLMLNAILIATVIGSWVSSYFPSHALGNFAVMTTLLIGLNFIYSPLKYFNNPYNGENDSEKFRNYKIIAAGIYVGLNCGILGGGGGMIMLFVFTHLFNYKLKLAVGTSTFVMTFTALMGSISHMAIGGIPNNGALVICIITTLIGAKYASRFANKSNENQVRKITGQILSILGTVMIMINLFF
jgi:uncharacterized membrane protein YfcA